MAGRNRGLNRLATLHARLRRRPQRLRVVSFSLYGDAMKYVMGARVNLLLAREVYPDWTVRIHCGPDVPGSLIAELRGLGADCRVIHDVRGSFHGMFWRFQPASDPDVDVMICRDLDSRLNWRERAAVDDWLASSEPFHIMRDHQAHRKLIMGCAWGVRGGFLQNMTELVDAWGQYDCYGRDEEFLAERVWPLIQDHHIAHDEFYDFSGARTRSFPAHRSISPWLHVGERVLDGVRDREILQGMPGASKYLGRARMR